MNFCRALQSNDLRASDLSTYRTGTDAVAAECDVALIRVPGDLAGHDEKQSAIGTDYRPRSDDPVNAHSVARRVHD